MDCAAAFARQVNGLLGAALAGALVLTTGAAVGDVQVRVVLHGGEPPLQPGWQDVVEASFVPTGAEVIFTTLAFTTSCLFTLPAPSYRACWSGCGMGDDYDGAVGPQDAVVNVFELALWPAPTAPDAVLRAESERGRSAHPAHVL